MSAASGKRRRVANVGPSSDKDPSPDDTEMSDLESGDEEPEADRGYTDAAFYQPTAFGDFGTYMRNKRQKLKVQEHAIKDQAKQGGDVKPQIFSGLRVYVNGYTNPPVHELRRLLVLHGGEYVAYLDRKSIVTHIVATNLTPSKRVEFEKYKVATPDWLTLSVSQGRLLPWRDFSLLKPGKEVAFGTQRNAISGINGPHELPGGSAVRQTLLQASSTTVQSPKKEGLHNPPDVTDDLAGPPDSKSACRALSYGTDPATLEEAAHIPDYIPSETNLRAQQLLSDPTWRAQHTSVSDDFIQGYYQQSRLHYLSTWKAELRKVIADVQQKTGKTLGERGGPRSLPVAYRGTAEDGRTIFHADFDCFFSSAGLIARPELRGRPVAVCHAKGTGEDSVTSTSEIASCSYEARSAGVRNGMSFGRARELCPDITAIPYNFDLYKRLSMQFYGILLEYADDLQPVSVDEAILDVSARVKGMEHGGHGLQDQTLRLAEQIRDHVRRETSCEVSIGCSHNILLARLAMRRAKPASAFHLLPADVPAFLSDLDVGDLPGVGWSIRDKIQSELATANAGELLKFTKDKLISVLGPQKGETMYNNLRGIDTRPLDTYKPRRSVSAEVNYGIRFQKDVEVEKFVRNLAEEVGRRLREINERGRQVTLKVMVRAKNAPVDPPKFLGHGHCDTHSRGTAIVGKGTLSTSDGAVIGEAAWQLMKGFQFDPKELRGIGIQVQKLDGELGAERMEIERGQQRLNFGSKSNPDEVAKGAARLTSGETDLAAVSPLPPTTRQAGKPVPAPATVVSRVDRRELNTQVPTQFVIPSASQLDEGAVSALPTQFRARIAEARRSRAIATYDSDQPLRPQRHDLRALPLIQGGFRTDPGNSKAAKAGTMKQTTLVGRKVKKLSSSAAGKGRSAKTVALKLTRRGAPPPSPSHISDEELVRLGMDVEAYRSLPREYQLEALLVHGRGHLQNEQSAAVRHVETKSAALPRWPLPVETSADTSLSTLRIKVAPSLMGKSSLDEIRDLLTSWMESHGDEGPAQPDVDKFASFIKDCVEGPRGVGNDLYKATAILDWWRYELSLRWPATDREKEPAASWWAAFLCVFQEVESLVQTKYSGTLKKSAGGLEISCEGVM